MQEVAIAAGGVFASSLRPSWAAEDAGKVSGASAGATVVRQVIARATPQHPRHTEGDMVRLKDGRWLMAYSRFVGAGHDESTADIVSLVSADGGKTWSAPSVMQRNVGRQNVMSVSLLRLTSGAIAFVYLVKNGDTDCVPYLRLSRDEAGTWSEPIRVAPDDGYHVLNNARLVQLSGGRLIAPMAVESTTGGSPGRDHYISHCYLSDDGGRSWRRGRGVDLPRRGAMEPGVIEKKDGRVHMILRTQLGRIYACESTDGGETFSEPRPTPLTSPESPATLSRIPSTGDWLMVFNPNVVEGAGHNGRRTPLATALSRDEGRTWGHLRHLEANPDHEYAYTSIRYDERNVHLTYYESDPALRGESHVHTLVPVEWLYG
jgi:sialidase-1